MKERFSMDDVATTNEADVKQIRMWIERYCATVTAGDFDGYRDFWTEDVVWLPPNTPIREGLEACMEYNRPLFEYYHSVETMTAEEIKVAGGWAFVRVDYTYRGTPKPGTDVQPLWEDGKGVFLLQRRPDASWVSTHCVWNSNLPIKADSQR
jgi:ketosteroid isomerase-like protein